MLELFWIALSRCYFLLSYMSGRNAFPEKLTPERERALILRMRRGDEEARRLLIEHNLRLVAHISGKFRSSGLESDDLISIGTIGLIKAVQTFSPVPGAALATYAAKCIENAILSQRNNRRLRWRNGCLLRQNGACWREWESAAIF